MEQEIRFNVGLFGRVLGTTTGGDCVDDLHIVYYDFIPANDCECVKDDVTDDPTSFINSEAPGDTFTVTVEELERFESDDEEEDSEEE